MGSLITPNDLFYVRNHLPVPHIKPEEYKLKIEGEGLRSVRLRRVDDRAAWAPAPKSPSYRHSSPLTGHACLVPGADGAEPFYQILSAVLKFENFVIAPCCRWS